MAAFFNLKYWEDAVLDEAPKSLAIGIKSSIRNICITYTIWGEGGTQLILWGGQ